MTEYHVLDQGRGPTLLLLHGFTGSSASWENLLPPLRERFRVLAVDLPGHGRTNAGGDVASYTMPRVAADVAQLLRDYDAAPAHVLGYSMGGRTALALAAHAPELIAHLIVESGSPGLAAAEERAARAAADEALAARIETRGITAFVDEWEKLPLFASQSSLPHEVRARLREARLRCDPRSLALSLCGMGAGAQPSLWDALPRLTMPVHLLVGALDAKFVAIARDMQRSLPHAALTIAPQAGHTVHLEDPATWLAVVMPNSAEAESAL